MFVQGQLYSGEIHSNSVALIDDVNGEVLFILKIQDSESMPKQHADAIVQLIHAADTHLPSVNRGKKAATVRGYMKCALERQSCCHGDYGLTKAEHQSPTVHKKVLRILAAACTSLRKAFPCLMLGIYARLECVACWYVLKRLCMMQTCHVPLCSAPQSAGLGQWFENKYYPFSLLAFTLGNYAAEMHKDTKDVGMGFISWYLSGTHNWFASHS